MPSEMVEWVAEALFCKDTERRGWQNSSYGDLAPEAKDEWRDLALAALKAMREPNLGMVCAAYEKASMPKRFLGLASAYSAMIDHEIKLAGGGQDG